MKKVLRGIIISIICTFTILLVVTIALFWNEIRSLTSLKKTDDYGMFQMMYYGDYGFDQFLETGAKSDTDIETFVTKRLLRGLPIDLGVTGDGCTAFVTHNDKGEIIYGRNFDFSYAPSMQLYTNPDNGYASVSTVNLAFAGYSEDNLPSGLNFDSFLTLAAPFLPFDGMNEKGVVMALLAVPEAQLQNDENKVTLNTTTAIRLVLDKAATVDEAVELLKQYNIYFSGDIFCHYLIADSSGRSVIVEYYDGGLKTVETDTGYQIASNFIAYNGVNIGEGYTEFERYDTVKATIDNNGGTLSEENAISLLADIGIIDENIDKLQWSVLYNLTTGEGKLFAHRNIENMIRFHIDIKK
jgi:hypothetical protein